ncbi:MAG: Resolvase protein [Paenibacillus sp.]|jgi:hypothetical protein|nr:Resolvase protein [Paenibacillus sp.]
MSRAYRQRALNGDYTGAFAPYGYRKDEQNKHKLISDENTSAIMQCIFRLAVEGIRSERRLNSKETSPLQNFIRGVLIGLGMEKSLQNVSFLTENLVNLCNYREKHFF